MNVSSTTSPDMEVLSLHARSQSYLSDDFGVIALRSFESRRSDVGCSATASAESAIIVIANYAFADDFTIAVAVRESVVSERWRWGQWRGSATIADFFTIPNTHDCRFQCVSRFGGDVVDTEIYVDSGQGNFCSTG